MLLKQSTARNRMIFMTSSTDHVSALTGATVTVTLSKDGGAFAALGGSVAEVSSGWYKIALNTTDTNTLGDLAYHATATGADPTDGVDQVVALLPGDSVTVGTNNDKTGYSLTQTFPTNFSSLAITAGGAVTAGTVSDKTGYSLAADQAVNVTKVAGTVQTARDLGAQLDATVSSRLASASYTAPDNTRPTNFTSMAIAATGEVSADVKKINAHTVQGTGISSDLWRG